MLQVSTGKRRQDLDEKESPKTHVLPSSESRSSENSVDVIERVVDLLVCVVLLKVSFVVPSALSRQFGDVADHDGLRVVAMAQVAVLLARTGFVDVLQIGHGIDV